MDRLDTQRTVLTPLRRSDFDDVLAMYRDPASFRYVARLQDASEAELKAFLNEKMDDNATSDWTEFWTVRERDTNAFVGTANLNRHPVADLVQVGCILHRAFWGRGLAPEIGASMLDYGLHNVGLDAIHALVERENAASRRVVEKLGFAFAETRTLSGTPVEVYVFDGSDASSQPNA